MSVKKNAQKHKQLIRKTYQENVGYAMLIVMLLFVMFSFNKFNYFNGIGLHGSNQYLFEKPLMYGLIFGVPALLCAALYMLREIRIERRHLLAVMGLVVPLVYIVSGINAESPYLSRIAILDSIATYAFFLVGCYLSTLKKHLNLFYIGYLSIGSIYAIYGFSYLIGNRYKHDALSYLDSVRLASGFTYPNAYAAFLLTLILANLHFLVKARRKWEVLALGFALAPLVASFLLTLSRGAIVALPIIALAILLISTLRKQVLMSIHFGIALLLGLLIQSPLTDSGNSFYLKAQQLIAVQAPIETVAWFSSQSLEGWARVLGIAVIMAIFVYIFQRNLGGRLEKTLERWELKRSSRYWIPCALTVMIFIGVVLLNFGLLSRILPDVLAQRLEGITLQTHSVLERLTFYKDSISMWLDRPLFGGGGGSWEALYEQYQSYPYLSSQTHSYPIQLLVETGVIGLLLIAALILYIIVSQFVRNLKAGTNDDDSVIPLLFSLSVLIHSLIDFEMNYFFFSAIVFFSLGVLAGNDIKPIKMQFTMKRMLLTRRIAAIMATALSITLLISISTTIYVNGKYNASITQQQQQQSFQTIMNTIEAGLKKLPNHPYLLERAGVLNYQVFEQTKDEQYIDKGNQYINRLRNTEPRFRSLPNISYTMAMITGDKQKVAQELEAAIKLYPFELSYYEQLINIRYLIWKEAYDLSNTAAMHTESTAIRDAYQEVEARTEELKQLPDAIIINRLFQVTTEIRLNVGKLSYYEGKYEESVSVLKEALTEELTTTSDQEAARYYLASTFKLGQQDHVLHQKLVAANPNEEKEILELLG